MSAGKHEFDRSKWSIEGASPEITADEQSRAEVCESYIRSAGWSPWTSEDIKAAVAMNVRGAWPVAFTQGWMARQPEVDRLQGWVDELRNSLDAIAAHGDSGCSSCQGAYGEAIGALRATDAGDNPHSIGTSEVVE